MNDVSKGIQAPDEEMPELETKAVNLKSESEENLETNIVCQDKVCVEEQIDENTVENPKRTFGERWKGFWAAFNEKVSSFYHNWLIPKAPLISKCFLSLCGVLFILLVVLGLLKVYETSTLLGMTVTLMVMVWLLKIGRTILSEVIYKALDSTIALLTSFKENLNKK